MALKLYRRHGSHCPGGRELHDRTYEADEFRPNWKKCCCPIYASGTLNGQFRRKNTERTVWTDAKAVAEEWESARSWDGSVKPEELPALPASDPIKQPARISISNATAAYLAIREGAKIALPRFASIERSSSSYASSRTRGDT